MDGFYGPITNRHIRAYQKINFNVKLIQDGVVDRARGMGPAGSNTLYTIVTLNPDYSITNGPAAFAATWTIDPGMDSELAWVMYAVSSQAVAA